MDFTKVTNLSSKKLGFMRPFANPRRWDVTSFCMQKVKLRDSEGEGVYVVYVTERSCRWLRDVRLRGGFEIFSICQGKNGHTPNCT